MASSVFTTTVTFKCGREEILVCPSEEMLYARKAELEQRACPMCRLEDGNADEWDAQQIAMNLASTRWEEAAFEALLAAIFSAPPPAMNLDMSEAIVHNFNGGLSKN